MSFARLSLLSLHLLLFSNSEPQPNSLQYGHQRLERRIAFGRERTVKRFPAEAGISRV